MSAKRVTETANELTTALDAVGPAGIVRLLRQSDAQLFAGWGAYPAMSDECLEQTANEIIASAATLLEAHIDKGQQNKIIFSGCGTSGRIAWLCSRSLNQIFKELFPGATPPFTYLISGGDEALILSKELPEDDPNLGVSDLQREIGACDNAMFFGITCGLSAPYVGGQIEYALKQDNVTRVLMGFNPVHLARDAPVENWGDQTCRKVFQELEKMKDGRSFVLNPIVGPEAVTGSSRMKGGSATKILLEGICCTALARVHSIRAASLPPKMKQAKTDTNAITFRSMVDSYFCAYRDAYRDVQGLGSLIELAGRALKQDHGRLYYLGADSYGLLGLIDASEMVDTYGTSVETVRAFVVGGWSVFANREGSLADQGTNFRLGDEEFIETIIPRALPEHVVILLLDGSPSDARVLAAARSIKEARLGCLTVCSSTDLLVPASVERCEAAARIVVSKEELHRSSPLFRELAMKIAQNTVTTGANVLRGAVYKNSMINLTVSNNKLLYRSAEIVAELTGCSLDVGMESLLATISEDGTGRIASREAPLSEYIKRATDMQNVVPTAALVATGKYSVADAKKALQAAPSLRAAITIALSS